MPKVMSPFKRKMNEKGQYLATPEIEEGYEWVFNDPQTMAIEKLDGTNVSVVIEHGVITAIFNRTARVPFFNNGKRFIIDGVYNSFERGYLNMLSDGQHFGELIGPKVQGNPYKLKEHIWIPFNSYARKNLSYKSWGKYPKDFETISNWFKSDLMPLYFMSQNNGDKTGFCEGIMFTHPDGRLAKVRKDMFEWYYENPNNKPHKHVEE